MTVNANTYPECLLGPFTVADDDGVRTSHGADVPQSVSTTDWDGGHSKVLNRWLKGSIIKHTVPPSFFDNKRDKFPHLVFVSQQTSIQASNFYNIDTKHTAV